MSDKKLDEILAKVNRIEGALYPDPGQPSRLTKIESRVHALELWRSLLTGAWAIITIGLGFVWKHK